MANLISLTPHRRKDSSVVNVTIDQFLGLFHENMGRLYTSIPFGKYSVHLYFSDNIAIDTKKTIHQLVKSVANDVNDSISQLGKETDEFLLEGLNRRINGLAICITVFYNVQVVICNSNTIELHMLKD